MRNQNMDVNVFVPNYYKKDQYATCYISIIYLPNGQSIWVRKEFYDLQPPPIKRQPRRPKKKISLVA